jgi:hypothetical protein
MKTLSRIIILCFVAASVNAATGYDQAMQQAIAKLTTAGTVTQMSEAGNTFDRIVSGAPEEWLPLYYGAYSRVIMAAMEQDVTKKDAYLDLAETRLQGINELENFDQSEVLALQGFLYMIRITVDPAARGQEYSMKSGAALQEAIAMDPQNPRAMLMLAQMSYGSAQFFNGDTSEACAMADTASQLLDLEAQNVEDGFAPNWGRYQVDAMIAQCKG